MMRRLAAVLATAVALSVGAALPATAAPSALSVDATGDVYSAGLAVDLSGSATCTSVAGTAVLTVRLRQDIGLPAGHSSSGQTMIVCDGQPHTWAVTVFSPVPYHEGTASVQAFFMDSTGTFQVIRDVNLV